MTEDRHQDLVEHRTVCGEVMRLHGRPQDLEEGDLLHRLNRFNFFVKGNVPISSIDLEEFSIDEDKVLEFMDLIRADSPTPPVVFDSVSNSMIDGFHRSVAHARLGLTSISAYVGLAEHMDVDWRESEGCEDEDDDSM